MCRVSGKGGDHTLDTDVQAWLTKQTQRTEVLAPTALALQLIFTTDALPEYMGKRKDRAHMIKNADTVRQAYAYLCKTYGQGIWNFEGTEYWHEHIKHIE